MKISLHDFNVTHNNLTSDNILSLLTQQDIIEYYLNDRISFNKPILSPFRDEYNPSFSFKRLGNGVILFSDWATNQSGDALKFVMTKFNCTFLEALKLIDIDFNLGLCKEEFTLAEKASLIGIYKEPQVYIKEKKVIDIIEQGFTISDYRYWKQFGISINTLLKFKVCSIKYLYINNQFVQQYSFSNPIYGYKFDDKTTDIPTIKIYMPYSRRRFYFNGGNNDIDGWWQLPNNIDLLILTKSRKDVMLLYECGYNAISLQSETYKIDIKLFEKIKGKCSNIVVMYDNDKAGIKFANRLNQDYGLKTIFTPEEKDISDYYRKFGKSKTKELLTKLFDEEEK